MRRGSFVVVISAWLGFGLTSPATAADMAVKAPAPTAPAPYNWSGFYLGANIGGSWSNGTANIAGTAWDPVATAFIGGLQLGYNWQAGYFLFGLEGDFDGSTFGRPNALLLTALGPVHASANQDWISTVAARFGLTWDKWLAYGKVGGGWARDRATLSFADGTNWTGSNTNGGWLAGGSNTPSNPTGQQSSNTISLGLVPGRAAPFRQRLGVATSRSLKWV